MAKKTRTFKTEVQQLLDLVIHSLYSKKEVFLRELISNASDAIDRARFEGLTHKSMARDESDWQITLRADRDARTLTVSDNGIGMDAEELEKHIGTIAHSGTRKFLDAAEQDAQGTADFIGQFGVGFYASFMVADRVTVITRRAGSDTPALRWESNGVSRYTMEETEREDFGTDVILHLREDMDEYLDEWRVRAIVKEYSDFIRFPISWMKPAEEADADAEQDAEPTPEEAVVLNSMKALWRKSQSDVKDEEYTQFYHQLGHDMQDPLDTIHFHAEGTTEFKALLYLPATPPFDLYMPREQHGLQLYVHHVFITDDCRDLLPEYLRFVKGVVDSSDLPLNVSREMLQDDAIIRRIRKSLVAKILSALTTMKEKRPEDYQTFWTHFGAVLKEGLAGDGEKEKLQELIQYPSTDEKAAQPVTLRQYVDRMNEDQETIYFLVGDRLDTLHHAPHLERLTSQGIEVLLMTDPVDEWVMQSLTEYDEKPMQAADRVETEKPKASEDSEESKDTSDEDQPFKDLLGLMGTQLDEMVKEVRLSDRLVDSASCLVSDESAINPHMERIMRAMNQEVPATKRILEVNPAHPILSSMQTLMEQDGENPRLSDYIELLLEQALLAEGSNVRDPARFARLVSTLMVEAAGQE